MRLDMLVGYSVKANKGMQVTSATDI
jgi:hypothetical protein